MLVAAADEETAADVDGFAEDAAAEPDGAAALEAGADEEVDAPEPELQALMTRAAEATMASNDTRARYRRLVLGIL